MPAVSELFTTYHDFASASLTDVYGGRLDKALKLKATHLESGIWINELSSEKKETLKFTWKPLPWDAQLAPINDIVTGDFNRDGKLEIILAQNHFTNWIETGYWRGNPGCHLEWEDQNFKVIPHRESGIILPNDSKSLLVISDKKHGSIEIIVGQNNDQLLSFKSKK